MSTATMTPIDADTRRLADLFRLAGDPTRLAMLRLLAAGEQHVGDLAESLEMAQPSMSHHLALCRLGGLIVARRDGKKSFYRLTEPGRALVALAEQL